MAADADAASDFYAILGCARASSQAQVESEYKVRALRLHPDKQGSEHNKGEDAPDATRESDMAQLNEARYWLGDASRRRVYDRWLDSGLAARGIPLQDFAQKLQHTMHWSSVPGQGQIEHDTAAEGATGSSLSVGDHLEAAQAGSALDAFRNYRI